MSDVASLKVKFESEGEDQVSKAADQVSSKLTSVGKKAQETGTKMTLGVTTPILAAGTAMFMASSDMDEAMSKVNVVFGDSSSTITSWADDSAASLGMAEHEALATAGTFGNLFTGMGLTQDAAAGMSMDMIQLATDLASFNNVPVEDALLAIRSGLVGEAEPLRNFGVLLDAATVEAKAMEMGLADANGEISEQAKVLARQQLIMEQTTNAHGDFVRTSEGAANSLKIARAELSNAAAAMGQHLVPMITKGIQGFTSLISKISELSPTTQKVILIIMGIAAAIGPLLVAFGTVAVSVGAITKNFGTFSSMLTKARTALMFFTGPIGLAVAAFAAFGLAYKTNFLGFGDAVDGVVSAITNLEIVKDVVGWFQDLGSVVSSFFSAFGADAQSGSETVTRAVNGMVETVENADGSKAWFVTELDDNGVPQRTGEIVESVANADGKTAQVHIKGEDEDYWATIDLVTGEIVGESTVKVNADTADAQSGFDRLRSGLDALIVAAEGQDMGWLVAMGGAAKSAVSGIEKLKNGFSKLNPAVKQVAVALGIGLLAVKPLAAAFGAVAGVLSPVVTVIKALGVAFAVLTSPIGLVVVAIAAIAAGLIYAYTHFESFRNIVDTVAGAIKDFWTSMTNGDALNKLQEMSEGVQEWLQSTADSIMNGIQSAWDNITNAVTSAFNTIKGVVDSIWSGISSGVGAAWDAIQTGITLAWNAITSLNWSEWINPLNWADWIVGKIGDFAGWIWEKISGFFPSASVIVGSIASVATWIWDKISGFFPTNAVIAGSIASVATWVWDKISTYFPVSNVIVGSIADVATWIWDKISTKFPVSNVIAGKIASVGTWLWDKIKGTFPAATVIVGTIAIGTWLWGKISQYFPSASVITDAIGNFGTWIWGKISSFFPSSSMISGSISDLGAWLYEKIGAPKVSIPPFPGWRDIFGFIPGVSDDNGSAEHEGSDQVEPVAVPEAKNFKLQTLRADMGSFPTPSPLPPEVVASWSALKLKISETQTAVVNFVANTIGVLGGWTGGISTMFSTTATNLTTLQTNVTTSQTAFVTFVANTIGVMGGWVGGISTMLTTVSTAFMNMNAPVSTATTSFVTFVASTIGVMGGWVGGINTMVTNAMTTFQTTISTGTTAGQTSIVSFVSSTIGVMGGWVGGINNMINSTMSNFQSRTSSGTSVAKNSVVSFVSQTIAVMGGWSSGFVTIVTGAMTRAASAASSGGRQIEQGIRSGAQGASNAVQNELGRIPGIINGIAGSAAANAYNAGAAIGAGFANGMNAYLGQIRAAASAMVSAADAAIRAKASISSPSKVFATLGGYLGEGFVGGIEKMIPAAHRMAQELVSTPSMPSWQITNPTARRRGLQTMAAAVGGPQNTGSSGNTYIVMTRSELLDIFDTVDTVKIMTDPVEQRAHFGGQ